MKQVRLRHVGILISDWDKIRPFYEGLGFKLFYEEHEVWFDRLNDHRFDLIVRKMINTGGDILEFIEGNWCPHHIALTVKELPRFDILFNFSRKSAVAETVFLQDPEGNWIEFVKEL